MRREYMLRVRMSQAEWQQLTLQAGPGQKGMSAWVRDQLQGRYKDDAERLRAWLNRIGGADAERALRGEATS